MLNLISAQSGFLRKLQLRGNTLDLAFNSYFSWELIIKIRVTDQLAGAV